MTPENSSPNSDSKPTYWHQPACEIIEPPTPEEMKPTPSPDKWDALIEKLGEARKSLEIHGSVRPGDAAAFHAYSLIGVVLSELRGMEDSRKNLHRLIGALISSHKDELERLREMERGGERVWIASYTASKFAGVLSRGLYFRSIHDSREEAEKMHHDPQANDFTVTEYVKVATLSVTEGVDGRWAEIKEDSLITDQMEMGRWMGKRWVITRSEGLRKGWELIQPNDFYTHYRLLNPPPQSGVDGREK